MNADPRRSRSPRPYAAPAVARRKPTIRLAPASPASPRRDEFDDASESDALTCAMLRPIAAPPGDVDISSSDSYGQISETLPATPPMYERNSSTPQSNDTREGNIVSPAMLPKSTPRLSDISASSEHRSRADQTSVRAEQVTLDDEMRAQAKPMTLDNDTKPQSIIVERRSIQAPRKRLVFAPGQVRLAVPLEVASGGMAPTVLAYMLFDGTNLEISGAMAEVPPMVDGRVIGGGGWERLKIPCTLQIGDDTFDVYHPDLKTRKIPHSMAFADEETRCHPAAISGSEQMKGGWTEALAAKATSVVPASPAAAPFVQLSTSTVRRDAPTTNSSSDARLSRRRRILAIASGAISAIITTMLLVGGSPSSDAVPRTKTAMASESVHVTANKDTSPSAAVANGAAPSAKAAVYAEQPVQGSQGGGDASTAPKASGAATSATAEKTSAPSGPTADATTSADDKAVSTSKSSTERVTLEREAVDLLARGAFMEAAATYRELARRTPDRPLFYQAAALAEQQAARASK